MPMFFFIPSMIAISTHRYKPSNPDVERVIYIRHSLSTMKGEMTGETAVLTIFPPDNLRFEIQFPVKISTGEPRSLLKRSAVIDFQMFQEAVFALAICSALSRFRPGAWSRIDVLFLILNQHHFLNWLLCYAVRLQQCNGAFCSCFVTLKYL